MFLDFRVGLWNGSSGNPMDGIQDKSVKCSSFECYEIASQLGLNKD
jgi:hypothetical protein